MALNYTISYCLQILYKSLTPRNIERQAMIRKQRQVYDFPFNTTNPVDR